MKIRSLTDRARQRAMLLLAALVGVVGCAEDVLNKLQPAAKRAWLTAQRIESFSGAGLQAYHSEVEIGSDGTAIALWEREDGTNYNTWFNRYTVDGNLETARLVESYDSGSAYNSDLGIYPDGTAIAVWQQFDGGTFNIWSSKYDPASNWGAAELVEQNNPGDALNPEVAVDANGNALAVWYQFGGTVDSIWSNRYSGGAWGVPELLESDDAGHARNPEIVIDPAGNAVAVWHQSNGTVNSIWANTYSSTGGWGAAVLLETDDSGDAINPQVDIDAAGNAIAIWEQFDGSFFNVWAARYTPAGGWSSAQLIENGSFGWAVSPDIALTVGGKAIAVWRQGDGANDSIWASQFEPDSGWGAPERIEDDDTGGAYTPKVGTDAQGNAIAVWKQHDGTRFDVWANHFKATTGWGSAQLIGKSTTGDAWNPEVAVSPDGNAAVIWRQSDGTNYSIWGTYYR